MGNKICCQTSQKIDFQTQIISVPQQSAPENSRSTQQMIRIEQHLNTYLPIKRILALDHNQIFINSLPMRQVILSSGYLNQMDDGLYISQENIENSKSNNGYGIMIGKDESYFQGHWANNMKNGKGILITKEGQYYCGDWKQNYPHGYGTSSLINPFIQYRGFWRQGLKHGQGYQVCSDGSKYSGEFFYGERQGYGKLIYPNQTQYQGDFKKNVQAGNGVYRGKNHIYEGGWMNGKMHGSGKSQWRNQNQQIIGKYIGQYRDGIKQGYGEYIDAKGTIYKAMWINGQINEQGPIDIQKISHEVR